MRNILKNPLKVIVVGMFVVAMGFGMSTSLKISETSGNFDLLALSSAAAQGESTGQRYKIVIRTRRGRICLGQGSVSC